MKKVLLWLLSAVIAVGWLRCLKRTDPNFDIRYMDAALGGVDAWLYNCLINSFPYFDDNTYDEIIEMYRKGGRKYSEII